MPTPPSMHSLRETSLQPMTNQSPSPNMKMPPPQHRPQLIDVMAVIGVAAFALCLQAGMIVKPRDRSFSLGDLSLSHPYHPDGVVVPTTPSPLPSPQQPPVLITWRLLAIYSTVIPLCSILFIDGVLRRTRGERTFRRMLEYTFGAGIVVLGCAILQLASSSLTPDFIERCVISSSSSSIGNTTSSAITMLTVSAVCKGDPNILALGAMSFPNTVASVSLYSMLLTSLYFRNHVYIPHSRLLPVIVQLLPIAGGVWCGASQYADGRASGVDILAGFALGGIVAVYIQYSYLGGLHRSFKGEDSTEVAEFLLMHSKPMDDPDVLAQVFSSISVNPPAPMNSGLQQRKQYDTQSQQGVVNVSQQSHPPPPPPPPVVMMRAVGTGRDMKPTSLADVTADML